MPTITVLYGHAYDGKNEETFRKCLAKIRRREGDSCVYLVRSDVRVRQLRDLVLRELSGYFHFPVSTFPDFIKTIYRKSSRAKRLISSLEQKLLFEDILRERERECGSQFYFNRFRDHPGILSKVKEFITGIRRIGIASPQELAERFRNFSRRRGQVYEELVRIFECYEKRLRTVNAIDDTGIFLDVAQKAISGQLDIHAYISSPELLVLEGYYELTLPEQQILGSLCSQFGQSILTLDTPLNPYNFPGELETPKPFRIFRDIMDYVRESGFSLRYFSVGPRDTEAQRREKRKEIDIASGALGLRGLSLNRLSVMAYRDRKEEVTEIARKIRTLYREKKITALHDVGVTFPVIEQYERFVREIFPLFGIPFTMFQGYSLASSPVVVTIFRLLRVILDGYSRETMGKLFSSPLVQFEMTEEEKQTNVCTLLQDKSCTPLALNADTYHYLDSLARSIGITGGREEWQEKLTQYTTQLQQQEVEREKQKTESDQPTAHCRLSTAYSLLNFLSRFETEKPRPPEELIDLLIEGIQRFQIPQRVVRSRQRKILENDASALQAFFRLLNTLKQELASSHRKSAQPYPLTLQKFFDLLYTAVQGETYYPPETHDESVFIMGRLDTRQVQFRYLFFGGLVERDFPGQDEPNIFLSDQEAEALGLPTYEKRIKETDHLFYLNLLNPLEKLYLSYPLQDGETDLLRSAYIDKVIHWQTESSKEEHDVSCEEVQHVSFQQNLENIFTYIELYQWLGTRVTQKDPPTHPWPLPGGDVLRFIEMEKGKEFVANFLDGLQAQRFRTSTELCQFDGVLASRWSNSLLHRSYSKHTYSVSEFDQYVRCPIKFFFQRVLSLEPLQEIPSEIPAIAIGTLLHRILYRFYTEQDESCTPPQSKLCVPGQVDREFVQRRTDKERWAREANIRMERIAREELELSSFSGVFGERFANLLLAGLKEKGVQDLSCKKGLLAAFIELEANDTDKVMPCYLNAHFGIPAFSEDKQTIGCVPEAGYILSVNPFQFRQKDVDGRIVSLKIRGKIDRIDLEPESSLEKETLGILSNSRSFKTRRAVIYDYKTGSVPSLQKIKDGLFFQLPLYLLAVQHFLGEGYEVVAGGYYQLKSPNDIGKKGYLGSKEFSEQKYFKGSPRSLFDTHEEFLKMLEDYKTRAVRTAQTIKEGRFHPTLLGSQDAGCHYCEYKQICRVDHQRMKNI